KQFEGPGGQDVIQDAGGEWLMFYHAYPKFIDANPSDPDIDLARYLMMDVVHWNRPDGWPRIHDGTPSN
ncbi:MAG: hypothetical protein ACRDJG_00250, partial [Actinomycetota bacterium]